MPKFKKDAKTELYYTYVPTGFYNIDGTREYKKLRSKDPQELERKVERFITDKNNGILIDADKITVEQWAEHWKKTYKAKVTKNTENFYNDMLKHILPFIGKQKIKNIREIQLQKLLNNLSESTYGPNNKPYSKKTVKEVKSVLFSLFETAQNNKLILGNPAAGLKISGAAAKKRRYLSPQESEKYRETCMNNMFGLFGGVLYYLGLRRGEALALKHSDFSGDFVTINKQVIYPTNSKAEISDPKTGAGTREIFIPENLQGLLLFWGAGEYYEGNPDDYVFQDSTGNPLSYSQFRRNWINFITSALGKDTDITPHFLRHNYATLLYDSGVDELTASVFMGHADIKTTKDIYTHLTNEKRIKSSIKIINI